MAEARIETTTHLALTPAEAGALRILLQEFHLARTTRDDQGTIVVLGQIAKDLDWQQIKNILIALAHPTTDDEEIDR